MRAGGAPGQGRSLRPEGSGGAAEAGQEVPGVPQPHPQMGTTLRPHSHVLPQRSLVKFLFLQASVAHVGKGSWWSHALWICPGAQLGSRHQRAAGTCL